MSNKKSIDLTDEFTEPTGEWSGYSAITKGETQGLREQKHVDIRSFNPDKPGGQVNMIFLDRLTMTTLDASEMGNLSSSVTARVIVTNNEEWSFGEVGVQSDRNNWNGIKVECKANQTTTTQSVIKQHV